MWMYLAGLLTTPGLAGPYSSPTMLLLLLLVSLLTTGSLVLLVIELKKGGMGMAQLDAPIPMIETPNPAPDMQMMLPGPMTNARARAIRMGKYTSALVIVALLSGGTGWLWRDHQLATKRTTYIDVYVREKINDHEFVMQPARMQPIDSTLCPESTVDWKEHETLRDWTFEQRHGCKRIISYHRQENLNVGL